jgi:hypothetical protein
LLSRFSEVKNSKNYLKNVKKYEKISFLYVKNNTQFSNKTKIFFIVPITTDALKYIHQTQFFTLDIMSIFRGVSGNRNDEKNFGFIEKPRVVFHIKKTSFFIFFNIFK